MRSADGHDMNIETAIEERARYRCVDDDGTPLIVVEYRHCQIQRGGGRTRFHKGATWLSLLNGDAVRYLDPKSFEVIATGEVIMRTV